MSLNSDVENYLKNLVPEYSSNEDILKTINKSSPKEIRNILSNILKDMSQISLITHSKQGSYITGLHTFI